MLLGAGSEGCWAAALQSSCRSKVLHLVGLVLLAEVVYTEEPCCPQVRAGQLGRSDVSFAQFIPCPALSSLLQLLSSANPPVPPQTASSMSFPTGMNDSSCWGTVPSPGFSSVQRSGMVCSSALEQHHQPHHCPASTTSISRLFLQS